MKKFEISPTYQQIETSETTCDIQFRNRRDLKMIIQLLTHNQPLRINDIRKIINDTLAGRVEKL